jgi:hypothetical protein
MPRAKENPPLCGWGESLGSRCASPAIRLGKRKLCEKHFRMARMQEGARKAGKRVPTAGELEEMRKGGDTCILCGGVMQWGRGGDRSRLVTLQHDQSGEMRFLCFSCNVRHRTAGDSIYELPLNHRKCASCKNALPIEHFRPTPGEGRPHRRSSRCDACCRRRRGAKNVAA